MAQAQAVAEINLGEVLKQVAREKEIDFERWVQALEDAMASAAKKQHRIKEPVRASFNVETGKFDRPRRIQFRRLRALKTGVETARPRIGGPR